ncbi:MAG: hypothetical protein WCJ29_02770 [bacterium]
MKKLYLAVSLSFGALLFALPALADSSPYQPPICSYTTGIERTPPTCSYVTNYPYIDLESAKDDYVFLQETYDRGGSHEFQLLTKSSTDFDRFLNGNIFAFEKKYFDDNGGLEGIFKATNTIDEEFGTITLMDPKDKTAFEKNALLLAAKSSDPDLSFVQQDDRGTIKLVNKEYSQIPLYMNIYVEAPLGSPLANSEWKLIYAPKEKFCEKTQCYLIMEQTSKERMLGKGESAVSIPIIPPKAETPELHWWQKFWNFLKNLF